MPRASWCCPGASTSTPISSSARRPGIVNADTFESATTAAASGGTTTVICFAAQHRGMNLMTVVEDYTALARKGAIIDYTFHSSSPIRPTSR